MKIAFNLNLKHYLGIIGISLPLLFGSASKGYDVVAHNLLGKARNVEEIYQRHMTTDHLLAGEEVLKKGELIADNDFKITTWLYKDGCAIIRYVEASGRVNAFKILPSPQIVNMLELGKFSLSNPLAIRIAEASRIRFDLGYHRNDGYYRESYDSRKRGAFVRRLYQDGCLLDYIINDYGFTYNWHWEYYKHR